MKDVRPFERIIACGRLGIRRSSTFVPPSHKHSLNSRFSPLKRENRSQCHSSSFLFAANRIPERLHLRAVSSLVNPVCLVLQVIDHAPRTERGNVTNSAVCFHYVFLLQEAESYFGEIAKTAAEQFHIYHGADQLILFHKNAFQSHGMKTAKVILGTLKQDTFGLKYLMVNVQEATPNVECARTHLPLCV